MLYSVTFVGSTLVSTDKKMMEILLFLIASSFCWCHGSETSENVINNQKPAAYFDVRSRFEKFAEKYEKLYQAGTDAERRFRIFRANLKKIETLNQLEKGSAVYGITQFTDLTKNEFLRYYTGLKKQPQLQSVDVHSRSILTSQNEQLNEVRFEEHLPTDFDWRNHNVVTSIKNQGMCGSCWAFSVTGNVEGQWAIKHKNLLSFSEQELVDCDKTDSGCEGGFMYTGYEAIKQLGGLELESDYPYQASDGKCTFNKSNIEARIASSVNITSNETEIAHWLYLNGPISIALNANAMQFYFGGVSHPFKFFCDPNDLDHGVLLVGFGIHETKFTKKQIPYWLIKNSWGSFWGEHGYYRLYRGAGVCGVNRMASSAIVI